MGGWLLLLLPRPRFRKTAAVASDPHEGNCEYVGSKVVRKVKIRLTSGWEELGPEMAVDGERESEMIEEELE